MAESETATIESTKESRPPDLSFLIVTLLKGVIYKENDERMWQSLMKLQARVRDYVAVIGLELILDEAEGYAFLRSKNLDSDEEHSEAEKNEQGPRLMARRPLSYPVSLLLALLRRRLAEFDQRGGDTRLIMSQAEIVQMVRVFFADGTNETKFVSQIETHLNKIVDLGFLRKMKPSQGDSLYEVRRIMKAFVDAQWLTEFDDRLERYKKHALSVYGDSEDE